MTRDEGALEAHLRGIAASAFDLERADADDILAAVLPDMAPQDVRQRVEAIRKKDDWGLGQGPAPAARAAALRAWLEKQGLDGCVVPLADEYQGEFIPVSARRLEWLTGFGGSAGLAIVMRNRAAIFVDGRYTLQVRNQVDTGLFEPRHLKDSPPGEWLGLHAGEGARIGYDPWLHTDKTLAEIRKGCDRSGAELVPLRENPVDRVWADRPPLPLGPVFSHDQAHAGVGDEEKCGLVGRLLEEAGCDAALVTRPDSIAWLLNVRGSDVANTPLPLSYAIIRKSGAVEWFIDRRKTGAVIGSLRGDAVQVLDPGALAGGIETLGSEKAVVRLDPWSCPDWISARLRLSGAEVASGDDPCMLPKATKNEVEVRGARESHVRDGAALCRFLAWLDVTAPGGGVTEISAADRLLECRKSDSAFRGTSFDTISGSGSNGAIVHYRVTTGSDRALRPGDVYLVDSGAQYIDGTTDVTRTTYIGSSPPAEIRDRFTRVLKGHIAIATVRFPAGTTGGQLDALARKALWDAGEDYDHGTGHGVGSYLGVHEGPQRISRMADKVVLEPGMILSNEPGFYKAGSYGIRIENLVVVTDCGGGMREFETLTLAPIDRSLIDLGLMTVDERSWLDAYHSRVRETLSPLVDTTVRVWLEEATLPV